MSEAEQQQPQVQPQSAARPTPPKPTEREELVDPEAFALRGRPPRAVRLRRNAVIALAACAALALALSGWLALRGRIIRPDTAQDNSQPATSPAEALGALPKTYADVPRLGPPLPGDLGKPVLDQQSGGTTIAMPAQSSSALSAPPADPARSQAIAEAHAAAGAPLLAHTGIETVNPEASSAGASATADGIKSAPIADSGPSTATTDTIPAVDPHRIAPLTSPYTLSAGSIIAANLITGLRSDLPGIVTAQVSQNVWDSATGAILLVPQGARLIGRYENTTTFGQKRLRIEWRRLIFPDGSAISLDVVPGTDESGHAGLEDKVNGHGWLLVKGAVFGTLVGISAELQFSGHGGLEQAIRQSGQQSFSQAGDKLTSRALDVQPTLEIRPGAPVRLVVEQDLVLKPVTPGDPS